MNPVWVGTRGIAVGMHLKLKHKQYPGSNEMQSPVHLGLFPLFHHQNQVQPQGATLAYLRDLVFVLVGTSCFPLSSRPQSKVQPQ